MKKVKILFKNQQKIVEITDSLKKMVCFCCKMVLNLERFKKPAEISVFFTDNLLIKKLNFKYKNKNYATDVLSFSTKSFGKYFEYEGIVVLGDVVISVEKALTQFKVYNSFCLEQEILRLTIHSMLHLLGYDHEKNYFEKKKMQAKEKILNKIANYKFKFERAKNYEKKL